MELGKSRLSALVVSTTAAGYLMAAGPLAPVTVAATLGGTFLCSASANSFNQLMETRNDAAMARTSKRPLPSGRITSTHAAGWAGIAGLAGVSTLALGTNCMTATLGAATLGLYTLVYTPMKQRTPLNTWVGAVVGAIPPVMGLTAAGGDVLSLEAATLGTALFLWQMPHFFALAWMYRADYALGGYRMVSLDDAAGERTARLCLEYSVYLAALPPLTWAAGLTSFMFTFESIAFNGALLAAAWRFHNNSSRGQAHARRLFLVSLAYLPVFFGCLLLHQKQRNQAQLRGATSTGDALDGIREAGRELCVHEQYIVMADAAERAESGEDARGGLSPANAAGVPATSGGGGSPQRIGCPVVVAEEDLTQAVAQATAGVAVRASTDR